MIQRLRRKLPVKSSQMAYEYYLQAHFNQQPQEISTQKILAIFRNYITMRSEDSIDLVFDKENNCTVYFRTTDSTTNNLMVSRPCSGKLGECLYQVMQLGNFIFFEPDGKAPIILAEGTMDHLPEDMIEALGSPVMAGSLKEFLELYSKNR